MEVDGQVLLVRLARPPRPCPGPQHRDIEARGRLRDRADPALLRVEVGAEAARAAGAGRVGVVRAKAQGLC